MPRTRSALQIAPLMTCGLSLHRTSRRPPPPAKVFLLAGIAMMLSFTPSARAQEGPAPAETKFAPQGTVYAELFGSGVAYSLNFDYRGTRHLALRAGLEGWGGSGGGIFVFPFTASGLIGKRQHNFEIGGGPVLLAGTGDLHDFGTTIIGSAFVAYRMQPPEGGFFFRAGIGPLFNSSAFLIWPVISLGVSF